MPSARRRGPGLNPGYGSGKFPSSGHGHTINPPRLHKPAAQSPQPPAIHAYHFHNNNDNPPHPPYLHKIGDKFGESLGGSQAPPSFWEVPGLPWKFPGLPRKFFGNFPGSSLTVELNSNPEVPRKSPKLPRKFPKLPRKFFGDFPGGQPLSLGSLTPSPDSQKLSLTKDAPRTCHKGGCMA